MFDQARSTLAINVAGIRAETVTEAEDRLERFRQAVVKSVMVELVLCLYWHPETAGGIGLNLTGDYWDGLSDVEADDPKRVLAIRHEQARISQLIAQLAESVLGISQPDVSVHIPAAVDDIRSIEAIFFEDLDLAEYFTDDRIIVSIHVHTAGEAVSESIRQMLVSVFTSEIRKNFGQNGVKVWVGYTTGHSEFNISFGSGLLIKENEARELVETLEEEFQRVTQQMIPVGQWSRISHPWEAYAY